MTQCLEWFFTPDQSLTPATSPPNHYTTSIINAVNPRCLGRGGADGSISMAGGPELAKDCRKLPSKTSNEKEMRSFSGIEVLTGPKIYELVHTAWIIRAVGSMYKGGNDKTKADKYLKRAYMIAMARAESKHLGDVAFSLLPMWSFCRGTGTTIYHLVETALAL